MAVATHLIKIKGEIDESKWTEETLRNFVNNKIKDEIESIYHPDLELFQVKDRTIEVWVYISDPVIKILGETVKNWLNIKEDGLVIESLEIEKSGNGFYVVTP
jgi:hypothetical protein